MFGTKDNDSKNEGSQQAADATPVKEQVSRRDLFSRAKIIGPLGALVVAAACSKASKFGDSARAGNANGADGTGGGDGNGSGNSTGGTGPEKDNGDSQNAQNGTDTSTGTGTGTKPAPTTVEEKCDPTNSNEIKLEALPALGMAFVPKFKFYGRPNRAMIVIDFDAYDMSAATKISKVILTHPNGKIIASRVITAADNRTDKALWFQVFDGINLKDSTKIVVVVVDSDDKYSKYLMDNNFNFEDAFQGKPVFSLADTDMPTNFCDLQAIANFDLNDSNAFLAAQDPKYDFPDPFKQGARKLYTAQSNATYKPASRIASRGFIVADLMGNVLDRMSGGAPVANSSKNFAEILDHPTFICYLPLKRVGTVYSEAVGSDTVVAYCRTVLKIG